MRVAAVVPCFRVRRHIDAVLDGLKGRVDHVYVVDDACPEETGRHVRASRDSAFVTVIVHQANQGVGGAVISGYQRAADDGYDILVKVDGDGQMDPAYLPALVAPIAEGRADYAKGNRFFDLRTLSSMPTLRLIGNSTLSLLNKLTSGYWEVMDPTNGYTAIHAAVLRWLPLAQIDRRYFFESDMLFRLGCVRARVVDVPMPARYGEEISNLRIRRVAVEFPGKYVHRFLKRIVYNYLLRGFNAGTILLSVGLPLLTFGLGYGSWHWWLAHSSGTPAASGVVMLAALPTIVGVQCLLSFLNVDVGSTPREPIWRDAAALPDPHAASGRREPEA
jgi:glycosyltransferase involved in cell wall biosynthesis